MAELQQPARLTPEQFAYSVICKLEVALAALSPEQRLDVFNGLQASVLRRFERERAAERLQAWNKTGPSFTADRVSHARKARIPLPPRLAVRAKPRSLRRVKARGPYH
jgi:hypothetical protein